jgi:hypothetical protein
VATLLNSNALAPKRLSLSSLDPRSWVDRRSHASRELLLTRVRGEYGEMPCLSLTLPQAMRLFGLREDICQRVLDALVAEDVLSRRDDDRYVSRSAGL